MFRPLRIEYFGAVYQVVRFVPEDGFPFIIAAFNNRYGRTGRLFQGRYKSIMPQKDCHLPEVCRQKGTADRSSGIESRSERMPRNMLRG